MTDLVRRYEALAEEFRAELFLEHYLVGSGRKGGLEVAGIYDRYAWLFAGETVDALKYLPLGRQASYLLEFAVLGHLQSAVRSLSEALTNHDLASTVTWDGQAVPYRRASLAVANEPDLVRRRDLEHRLNVVTAEANPLRQERLAATHQAATELGLGNYVEMCNRLRRLNLPALEQEVKRFMNQTDSLFREQQAARFHRAKIPAETATNADAARLMRAVEFDHLFPPEKLVQALRSTLRGLGIDLDGQSGLYLDVEPRPLKSPRAFCSSIRVPGDVRLVVAPRGGVDDYRALMHEAGHAEHAVGTDRATPFAYKRLGDTSVTEMYAFLFDNLVHDPRWLRDTLNVRDDECRRLSLFYKLRLLRRYGAKLTYELELHQSEGEPALADRYTEILSASLRVQVAPENYLSDVDDALYCAQYLRAWLAEIQLRRFMEREFGDGWFSRRAAGDVLRDLWLRGQELTAEEILEHCGCRPMNADSLVAEAMTLAD